MKYVNGLGETKEQEEASEKLLTEIVEKLKGLTLSNAKRVLENANYRLENKLILS
jgi:hypothetical protein